MKELSRQHVCLATCTLFDLVQIAPALYLCTSLVDTHSDADVGNLLVNFIVLPFDSDLYSQKDMGQVFPTLPLYRSRSGRKRAKVKSKTRVIHSSRDSHLPSVHVTSHTLQQDSETEFRGVTSIFHVCVSIYAS